MLFVSVHGSVVSHLSLSCHKTVMQHHEHAKQKLRDELQAQFAADIDQQVAAHAQETQQARLVAQLMEWVPVACSGCIAAWNRCIIGKPSKQLVDYNATIFLKCWLLIHCLFGNT